MRTLLILLCVAVAAGQAAAQSAAPLARADSAIIARVLLAEQAGDTARAIFVPALQHPDARVHLLARRALARITDSLFAQRDSLPAAAPAPAWPEPAWRMRYRAINRTSSCSALTEALADSAWPVRLHAADEAVRCADHAPLVATLTRWLEELPADASRRPSGGISWHAGAHALQTLSIIAPEIARAAMTRAAAHAQWQVRRAAARAAFRLADTVRLRQLTTDHHPNVQEASIELLSRSTGHADDARYLAALESRYPQVVRVAALALAGSPDPTVAERANRSLARWTRRQNASARDVRLALLAAAGRSPAEDQPPVRKPVLPPDAVALALGTPMHLRVQMSEQSGGGGFTVRLRGDVAPLMAGTIAELVRKRYYDGLTWHRVEHDFVIQGGSPAENEYAGYERYLRDELGTLAHPRGTVGMSTRGHDTGDAQWFVNLRDNARLRRDYTVFAEVTAGIDVVDGVMEGDRIASIRIVDAP